MVATVSVDVRRIEKNNMNYKDARVLLQMLVGDPVQAIESAKAIVGGRAKIYPAVLVDIARTDEFNKWSRIAAVYALGFLGHRQSVPVLVRILSDRQESLQVRSHAAEALGNIRDSRSIPVLERVLMGRDRGSIKRWCVYALSEINSPRALHVLKRLAATTPTGVVAKELKSVFRA